MPGQTVHQHQAPGGDPGASMEGRTIARPNSAISASHTSLMVALQWRAGQLPGQTGGAPMARVVALRLQWRAGQLPGQTDRRRHNAPSRASFNGGPDNCPAKLAAGGGDGRGVPCASMEGRTIARPNNAARTTPPTATAASMEGRTIARPNPGDCSAAMHDGCPLQWRAGQLPGQTPTAATAISVDKALQWRAGQLPGQTSRASSPRSRTRPRFNGGPDNCPAKRSRGRDGGGRRRVASMEGRTIARPNSRVADGDVGLTPLQWRAGQLPGQTSRATPRRPATRSLQWRAGQLPGQTSGRLPMMRGGDRLQWRAGQLPGQTTPPAGARGACRGFNGGPDNCPAKHLRGWC